MANLLLNVAIFFLTFSISFVCTWYLMKWFQRKENGNG